MTNAELKALCLQVECSSFERDVAESILRLLAQCEAMREAVDAANSFMDHYCEVFQMEEAHRGKHIERFKKALSQLGERT